MKKVLVLLLVCSLAFVGYSQKLTPLSKSVRDQAALKVNPTAETMNFSQATLPSADGWPPAENVIGGTRYDLQTNVSCQNRIHFYKNEGTFGATFTYGVQDATFPDRGTGYCYFDGTTWSPPPTARIETVRSGWPSYSPLGDGEIVISHMSDAAITPNGLRVNIRPQRGTGTWAETVFLGPTEAPDLLWPRMMTGGVEHSVIHLIALTRPVANGGVTYLGQDGALLYSRSADGGVTWDPQNQLFDDLGVTYYKGFQGDSYEIISRDDNVAFLLGDAWYDLMLWKSTDGGDNWQETVIWEHPYPGWNGAATDTFFCADGAHHLAYDQNNMIHVVFGINRAHSDGSSTYWFPFVDGLAYWNETMPTFSSDMNALSPYGDPGSELIEDYNLIGWTQDVDGDGEITFVGYTTTNIGAYYIGLSSMPQITIDELNRIFIVFSSVTETFATTTQNFRHLWCRTSPDLGTTWGDFYDLSSDLIHMFDECVFPSVATLSDDDNIYVVYQTDGEPGLAARGDEDPYGDNFIYFMKLLKSDVVGIKGSQLPVYSDDVQQNYPNPAGGTTVVGVNLRHACHLSIEVTNTMGETVLVRDAGLANPGYHHLALDVTNLAPGMYFYTVAAGDCRVSKKMMVE